MGPAERIRSLRLGMGHSEESLAEVLRVTPRGLHDLEEDDAELETVLSIPQALKLADMLSTDLLDLLGEADKPAPLPLVRLRAALIAAFARSPDLRENLEDEIDWDLGPLLEGLLDWSSVYSIAFVKRLAAAMELDWRAVLLGIALA